MVPNKDRAVYCYQTASFATKTLSKANVLLHDAKHVAMLYNVPQGTVLNETLGISVPSRNLSMETQSRNDEPRFPGVYFKFVSLKKAIKSAMYTESLKNQFQFIIVHGPPGCGKDYMVEHALRQCSVQVHPIHSLDKSSITKVHLKKIMYNCSNRRMEDKYIVRVDYEPAILDKWIDHLVGLVKQHVRPMPRRGRNQKAPKPFPPPTPMIIVTDTLFNDKFTRFMSVYKRFCTIIELSSPPKPLVQHCLVTFCRQHRLQHDRLTVSQRQFLLSLCNLNRMRQEIQWISLMPDKISTASSPDDLIQASSHWGQGKRDYNISNRAFVEYKVGQMSQLDKIKMIVYPHDISLDLFCYTAHKLGVSYALECIRINVYRTHDNMDNVSLILDVLNMETYGTIPQAIMLEEIYHAQCRANRMQGVVKIPGNREELRLKTMGLTTQYFLSPYQKDVIPIVNELEQYLVEYKSNQDATHIISSQYKLKSYTGNSLEMLDTARPLHSEKKRHNCLLSSIHKYPLAKPKRLKTTHAW